MDVSTIMQEGRRAGRQEATKVGCFLEVNLADW